MYIAVRRYEGVSDSQKVRQLVDEGFVPILNGAWIRGFLLGSTRGRRSGINQRLRAQGR